MLTPKLNNLKSISILYYPVLNNYYYFYKLLLGVTFLYLYINRNSIYDIKYDIKEERIK